MGFFEDFYEVVAAGFYGFAGELACGVLGEGFGYELDGGDGGGDGGAHAAVEVGIHAFDIVAH